MFSKKIRLGKDAELKVTPQGKQLVQIAGAYDVGYGDKKTTVWINGAYWRDATNLLPYLTKGSVIVIIGSEVVPETYINKQTGNPSATLKMNILEIDLVSSPDQKPVQQVQRPVQQVQRPAQQAPQQRQQAPQAGSFADFDDDIPF